MKHLRLFENFEIVDPIKYGEPLNNREINFLQGYNIMCPEWILKDDNYYYVFDHRCENIKDVPETYINAVCSKYNITNYTINDDYTLDVDGNVDLDVKSLIKIPLIFNAMSGHFSCYHNQLTTLKGSPKRVGGIFLCNGNRLITLEGSPKEVGGNFDCFDNKLTTLEGSPKRVGGDFDCSFNYLTTLEGSPEYVRDFNCYNNKLTTIEGGPKYVGRDFNCYNNPLTSVEYKGIIKGKLIYR